jgi:hypothetical protein
VRHAVNRKVVPHNDDDLWSFVMLPDAGPVSTAFPLPFVSPLVFLFVLTAPTCRR